MAEGDREWGVDDPSAGSAEPSEGRSADAGSTQSGAEPATGRWARPGAARPVYFESPPPARGTSGSAPMVFGAGAGTRGFSPGSAEPGNAASGPVSSTSAPDTQPSWSEPEYEPPQYEERPADDVAGAQPQPAPGPGTGSTPQQPASQRPIPHSPGPTIPGHGPGAWQSSGMPTGPQRPGNAYAVKPYGQGVRQLFAWVYWIVIGAPLAFVWGDYGTLVFQVLGIAAVVVFAAAVITIMLAASSRTNTRSGIGSALPLVPMYLFIGAILRGMSRTTEQIGTVGSQDWNGNFLAETIAWAIIYVPLAFLLFWRMNFLVRDTLSVAAATGGNGSYATIKMAQQGTGKFVVVKVCEGLLVLVILMSIPTAFQGFW